MASKVNYQFVGILVAVVVISAGGVMFAASRLMTKSADDHVKTAEEFEAKGDYDKAAGAYSKAVSKSKGRPEYIQKWISALEKITPASQQTYIDRFQKEYVPALRALAEAQADNADAQRPVLDLVLAQYRMFPPPPSTWEAFIAQADSVIRAFQDGDKTAQPLRFYRGAARTNWLSLVAAAPDDAVKLAKDDLEAALEAEPKSARVMAKLCDWYQVAGERARSRRQLDEADNLAKEAKQRAEAFIAANAAHLPVLWSVTQAQIIEEARAATGARPLAEQYRQHHPKIKRLIDQVLAEAPEQLDTSLVYQVGAMSIAAGYPEAIKEATSLLSHAAKTRPNDVFLISKQGELEIAAGQYTQAIQTLEQIVKMPDRPLSVEGMLLFGYRELALSQQADCTLVLYNKANQLSAELRGKAALAADPAEKAKLEASAGEQQDERDKLLTQAKVYRDRLTEQVGKTARVDLLNAKLKFCENDMVEARRLLGAYVDQNAGDLGARRLLADVLARQGNAGAAKRELDYVLERTPGDVESLVKAAVLEKQMNQLNDARRRFQQVLDLDPGNVAVQEQIRKLGDVIGGTQSTDPVVRVLSQAQDMVTAAPPDQAGALTLVRKLIDDIEKGKLKDGLSREVKLDETTTPALARALVMLDDRDGAKALLTRFKGNNPRFASEAEAMVRAIDQADPVAAMLDAIDKSGATELNKHMLRYQTLRKANRFEEARAALALAKGIDGENQLVLSASFDEALAQKDLAEAGRIYALAAKGNWDKSNGLVFKFQIERANGRNDAAAAIAQQIIDQDPRNPLGHRMLGGIRLQMGMGNEALAAFNQALQINPADNENIKGKVRALIQLRRLNEALLFCREAKNFAASDAEFADMLLTLEGESGNIDFAIDRREKQLVRDPKDRTNMLELGALLVKQQRFPRAREVIDLARQTIGDNFLVMQLDARWHAKQGNLPKARELWEAYLSSLKAEELTMELLVTYSTFLVDNGGVEPALEVLEKNRARQTAGVMQIDREMGDVAFHAGRWEKAAECYARAMEGVTKDEGNLLRFRVIEATLRQRLYAEADALCEKAVAAGVPEGLEFMLLRAEAAAGKGDQAAARKALDRAVALDPNRSIGYYKRAEFLSQEIDRLTRTPDAKPETVQQTVRDATKDLETALRIDPAFAPARKMLARISLLIGSPDGAIRLLQEGVAIDPDNGPLRGELASILAQLGKTAEAIEVISDAMKRSKDPNWNIMQADMLRQKAEIDKAIEQYEIAWEKGVRSPPLARVLVDTRLSVAKPDLARCRAILADPAVRTDDFPQLVMMRAKISRRESRWDDVQTDVKAAITRVDQTSPASAAAFFQDLGDVYSGRIKDMVTFINSTKPAEGFSEPFRAQIIRFMIQDEALEAAGLADLDDLIATTRNKAAAVEASRLLGDLMFASKRYSVSEKVYERYLKLRPEDANIQNNLAYLKSKFLKKHQEALPLAQSAAAALPNSSNVIDTLGSVQLENGLVGEAESTLARAYDLAKTPDQQTPILIHQAQTALARNNRAKAADLLLQADRLMTQNPVLRARFGEEYSDVRKKLDLAR